MGSAFVIFPNQLYEDTTVNKAHDKVFLVEDPIYFNGSGRPDGPIRPNKIKIAYLRAASKWYFDNVLEGRKKYIDCQDVKQYEFLQSFKQVFIYDPTDHNLLNKLSSLLKDKLVVLESPNFIMSLDALRKDYPAERSPRHSTFYNLVKSTLGILESTPNLDKYNRGGPPKSDVKIPGRHIYTLNNKYYNEGIRYANMDYFSLHVGNPMNVNIYPITHLDAYKALEGFLKEKFNNFGRYQDAILEKEVFMFHSNISAALNTGLLNPRKVVEITKRYSKNVPLESFEGFIRQVIGWREFMRYLYMFHHQELLSSNVPDNTKVFRDPRPWYNGTTGIYVIDNEIRKAVKTGYSHHIVRLMVFMNFFILCNLDPRVIYKWFMEVVSIDAYDWVMVSNIYAMGYFTNKAMSRPYISTSSYVIKMSNYKKDGHWDKLWDSLFYNFISTKPKAYVGAYSRNLGYWKENKDIVNVGKKYIQDYFVTITK